MSVSGVVGWVLSTTRASLPIVVAAIAGGGQLMGGSCREAFSQRELLRAGAAAKLGVLRWLLWAGSLARR